MALIANWLADRYNYVFEELADPRVKPLFLMGSPFPILCIVLFYLYFVFKLGPKFMKDKQPFNIERLLVVYNSIQIMICFYLVVMCVRHTLFTYSIFCEPIDYSPEEFPTRITRHVWIYFMLKVADLFDTVFFVLRKKTNQITFLHVYHHTGMCLLGWVGTKYLAGGHGVFIGFINCIVHVVMYFYYLLSAWDKEYKKNVWWKKHITQLQIIQFVILVLYFGQLLFQPSCNYPKWTVWAFLPQNFLMIVLFSNFYIKTYVKTNKPSNKLTSDQNGYTNNNNIKPKLQ